MSATSKAIGIGLVLDFSGLVRALFRGFISKIKHLASGVPVYANILAEPCVWARADRDF
jgi:hypothetical protein